MAKRFSLLFDDDAPNSEQKEPLGAATVQQDGIPISKQIKFRQLVLQWPIGSWRKYGVQIDFSEDGAYNEIKYETVIRRLEDHDSGDRLFEINRSADVWINEKEPDLVMDKLAHETGKVVFPLLLRIDAAGVATAIENYAAILQRWPDVKNNLSDYFEGEFFDQYVAKIEQVLFDIDRFTFAVLYRDWFLQSYFLPIFKNYGEERTRMDYLKFPLPASFGNPGFFSQQTIADYTTDQGAIELTHRGELQEDKGLTIQKYTGSYEGIVRLHPFHNHIVAYKGEWKLKEYNKNISVVVKYFELDNPSLFGKNNWMKEGQRQVEERGKDRQASLLKKLFN